MVGNRASRWLHHGGTKLALEFSPDGIYLIGASSGSVHGEGVKGGPLCIIHTPGEAILWNTTDWTVQARFQDDYLHHVAWHPAKHILATSSRTQITLWDVAAGITLRRFLALEKTAAPGEYTGLAFAPDGQTLAVCSEYGFSDADVLVLDSETGGVVGKLDKLKDGRSVYRVKFLPDGKHVVGISCSYEFHFDRAYTWDAVHYTHLTTFDFNEDGYGSSVWLLESSPDGQILVTVEAETLEDQSDDVSAFEVRLWDSIFGRELAKCTMAGKCFCFGISPDASLLATMSADVKSDFSVVANQAPDYILTLTDLPSGQIRASLKSPHQEANLLYYRPESLRFSPDGRWLAVSHHKHVEVWDVRQILEM